MSNRTILLIDYDPHSIESAIKPLTGAGFTVEVANDGISGLQAFERLHPDLVLIEPMVPKKHGFEVCQEIKGSDHGRSVPVLITTGFYRGRKHQLEAKQFYGCDEYLEKPIAEELLVSTCQKYFDDEPDEPRLLEDLEADGPATACVPEEGLPELQELSEEEIVARLDDLIKEDPDLFADEPAGAGPDSAPEALDGDAAVSEPEPPTPPASGLPVAEPAVEEPSSAEKSPEIPEDAPVLLGRSAEVTYGAPGTGAEAPDLLPIPEEEIAALEQRPASSSRRLWIIAAAAGLFIVVAAGIVLGPRLLRGDDAAPVATAPAAQRAPAAAPAPAAEPVVEELAESPGRPPAAADGAAAEAARDDGPARPAATPAGRNERSSEPASRPEPKPSTPEPRTDAARQAVAQPSPAPPRSTPTETPVTPTARAELPASTGAEETAAPAEGQKADDQAGEPVESVPAPASAATAEPVPEPPAESAPSPRETMTEVAEEDAATAAPESAEAGGQPEAAQQPVPTPAPVEAAPVEQPRVQRRKVIRGTLLDISQVDTMPEPLNKRPPDYPPLARRLRIEGSISLRLLVDERGRVREVETITADANGVLSKAAERAASEWTYRPATKDNVPVKVWITERVVFQR